jgi:anti-sigma B factor antagonist
MTVQEDHTPPPVGTFHLSGDIDLASAPRILEEIVAYARTDGGDDRLVIDCSALTFIDSTGLSALEAASKKTGRQLVLVDLPDQCRRVFEITGLDQIFQISD